MATSRVEFKGSIKEHKFFKISIPQLYKEVETLEVETLVNGDKSGIV